MRPFRLAPIAGALATLFGASGALALPTGADIRGGQAAISATDAKSVVVRQDSSRLAIDWKSFGIAAGESVRFVQPSAASIALNRVVGNNRSEIYGNLSANGQVFLVNQNGILFGPSAQIDVGGLVASTLELSTADFMAGKTTFSGSSTSPLLNQGRIGAASRGYVALLGSNVRNEGVIEARLGSVALAAGGEVSLNLGGASLVSLSVDRGVVGALAENRQLIQAEGGRVWMSARAADAVVRAVVNNAGVIEANSVSSVNGVIRLEGLGASTVTNSGTISAHGDDSGTTGGSIEILGERVGLMSGARLDASGNAGGGTVLVGGNWQGSGPQQNATVTYVAPDAAINADAVANGKGGKVVVWADDTTRFFGSISARGGARGGDGGQVETSGKRILEAFGSVSAGAPHGTNGEWLLDPNDLNIQANAGVNAGITTTGSVFDTIVDSAVVDAGLLGSALTNGTNVKVQTQAAGADLGSGKISVNGAVSANLASGQSASLNLNAQHNIVFTAAGSVTGGAGALNVNLNAGMDATLTTPGTNASAISMAAGSSISTGGGNLTATSSGASGYGGSSGITLASINTGAGSLTVNSNGGAIGQTAASITVGGTTTLNSGAGVITLTMPGNDFQGSVNLSSTANPAAHQLQTINSLQLGTVSLNDFAVLRLTFGSTAGSSLTQTSPINASTIEVSLQANGDNVILDQANTLRWGSGIPISLASPSGVTNWGNISLRNTASTFSPWIVNPTNSWLPMSSLTLQTPGAPSNDIGDTYYPIVVTGATTLNAGAGSILLQTQNDFQGPVNLASSRDIIVTSGSLHPLNLNSISVATRVSAVAGNDIVLTGPITTANVTNGNPGGSPVTLSAGGAIALNANNIRTGDASIVDLFGISDPAVSGSITLTAGRSITGSGRLITGSATVTGVDTPQNHVATSGSISVTAGHGGVSGGIGLSAANALTTGSAGRTPASATDTAIAGSISLSSRDEINNGTASTPLQIRFGAVPVSTTLTQGKLSVNTSAPGGNAFVTAAEPLLLDTSGVGGKLQLATSGGSISQLGALEVAGTANMSAAGSIDLSNAFNNLQGAVTLQSANVLVNTRNLLTLNATGTNVQQLDARAGNEIRLNGTYDTSAGVNGAGLGRLSINAPQVRLTGDTTLITRQDTFIGQSVIGPGKLTIDHNSLDPTATTTAGGVVFFGPNLGLNPAAIVFDPLTTSYNPVGSDGPLAGLSVNSTRAIGVPNVRVNGNLSVNATNPLDGGINQFGSAVSVTGTSVFNGTGGVDMSGALNDLQGAVTLKGTNTLINTSNVLTLNATGTDVQQLDARAGGEIRLNGTYDTSAGVLGASLGRLSINAPLVRLMGDTTLVARQDTFIGNNVTGPGKLTIDHNGLDPSFATSAGGSVSFGAKLGLDPTLAILDPITGFVNPLGASGPLAGLSVSSTRSITLPNIWVNGNLSVNATNPNGFDGGINQLGSAALVTGTSLFNGTGVVDMSSAFNNLQGAVTLKGTNALINTSNLLTLNATGTDVQQLDARAGQEIRLSGTYDFSAGVNGALGRLSINAPQVRLTGDTTLVTRQDTFIGDTVIGPGRLTIDHNGLDPSFTTTAGGSVSFGTNLGRDPHNSIRDPITGLYDLAGADGPLAGLSVTSTKSITLPSVQVTGNLSVNAANPNGLDGGINQQNSSAVWVTGTSVFNGTGSVDMSNSFNDLQGAVTLKGTNALINTGNLLTLNPTGTDVQQLDARAGVGIRLSGVYDTTAGVNGMGLGRLSINAPSLQLTGDTTLRTRQDTTITGSSMIGPGKLTIDHNGLDPTFATSAGGSVRFNGVQLGMDPASTVLDPVSHTVVPAGANGPLAGLSVRSSDSFTIPAIGRINGDLNLSTINPDPTYGNISATGQTITGASAFGATGRVLANFTDFQGPVSLAGSLVNIYANEALTLTPTGTGVLSLNATANKEVRLSGNFDTSAGVNPGAGLGELLFFTPQIRLIGDTTLKARQTIVVGGTVTGPGALTIEHNGIDPLPAVTAGGNITFNPGALLGISPTATIVDASTGLSQPVGAGGPLASLDIRSTAPLALPSVTANGSISAVTSDNLQITTGSVLSSGATGNAIVLAAGHAFANDGLATAISAPAGRWLVYSDSPALSVEGGLVGAAGSPLPRLYNRTFAANGPGTISEAGNHLIYGVQPVLNLTANNVSRAYGDPNPPLTYSTSGFVVDDGVTDTAASAGLTGSLSTTAVATSPVSVGPYAITQGALASSSGYAINYTGANLAVNRRPVTVTADAGQSKVYGNADPGAYAYTNTSLGSGIALSGALTRAMGENVGSYAIGQGTLTNGNNSNYSLTFAPDNFAISQRPVTVTANAGQSKLYGNTDPALTYGITSGTLVGTDAFGGSLTRAPGENVGSFAIDQGTLGNSNYLISYVGSNFGITPRPVTLTANAGQSKVYGNADPAGYTYTNSSLGSGLALSGALSRAAGENAGSYAIGQGTLSDANNANYALTFVANNFSITPRPVTLTANAGQSKVYGNADPAGYTYTNSSLGSGLALSGALIRAAGENAGSYAIGQGTLSDANNANYALTFVANNFSITPRPVSVTANAGQGKVYGNADPASYSYSNSGLGSGLALTGALSRAAGENAGGYAIGQGTVTNANNPNYALTFVADNFTISPRPLSIAADDKSKLQGYPNPPLTATYSGFAPTDNPASLNGTLVLSTPATTGSPVGTYPIAASGQSSGNYTISYVDGRLKVTGNDKREPVRVSIAEADHRYVPHQREGGERQAEPRAPYAVEGSGLKLPEGAR